MAEKTKPVNYTPEMVAKLHSEWAKSSTPETLERLEVEMGRTVASLRQRLVRDGLYTKAPSKDKNGSEVVTKEVLSDMIAQYLPGVTAETAGSLAKANKGLLKIILKTLKEADEFRKAAQESFDQSGERTDSEQEHADMEQAISDAG